MTFPKNETDQVLTNSSIEISPSYSAAATEALLPVKSWPPDERTNRRLTGMSAAKIILCMPGLDEAMPGMLPATTVASSPANPT